MRRTVTPRGPPIPSGGPPGNPGPGHTTGVQYWGAGTPPHHKSHFPIYGAVLRREVVRWPNARATGLSHSHAPPSSGVLTWKPRLARSSRYHSDNLILRFTVKDDSTQESQGAVTGARAHNATSRDGYNKPTGSPAGKENTRRVPYAKHPRLARARQGKASTCSLHSE